MLRRAAAVLWRVLASVVAFVDVRVDVTEVVVNDLKLSSLFSRVAAVFGSSRVLSPSSSSHLTKKMTHLFAL